MSELHPRTQHDAEQESLPPPEVGEMDSAAPASPGLPRPWRAFRHWLASVAMPEAVAPVDADAETTPLTASGDPTPDDLDRKLHDMEAELREAWDELPRSIRRPAHTRNGQAPELSWLLSPLAGTVDLLALSPDDRAALRRYVDKRDVIRRRYGLT